MTVQCSLGHENPDGSAFCDECGEPLTGAAPVATAVADNQPQAGAVSAPGATQTCPSCGAQNPVGEAFCSNCGANMMGTPAPAVVASNPVTVMPPASVDTQAPDAGLGTAPAVGAAPTAAPTALTARLIVE